MTFDFLERFKTAFNYLPTSLIDRMSNKTNSLNIKFLEVDDDDFDDVILSYGKKEYLFAFRDDYSDVFATPPMLSIKKGKKIVQTDVDNSDAIVVESSYLNPYEISWKGLIIDMENHTFPLNKLKTLNEIFDANHEWEVASKILNKLKIYAVYMKSINIEFIEGYEDTIAYTLNLKSIEPVGSQITQSSNEKNNLLSVQRTTDKK